ncbi:MAG: polysaccharide deacetylase family protein [Magnetococcales bacterium]|nr:polysaccharide deacetylase family protein [Magnetococcales bacterium]
MTRSSAPPTPEPVILPADLPPLLMVVVDTEEAFDWQAPFRRDAISVEAMAQIGLGQAICDAFGVKPVYVIDHPVATQAAGADPLRPIVASGRALLGAHLHPWNTPPFEEELNARNSYPGNLPAPLEAAKLANLTDAIEQNFDLRPQIYKAGRYGLGPNTPAILDRLGYRIDLSPSPPFDFSPDGGPDFSGDDARPFWSTPDRGVLTLPTTGGYYGLLATRQAHRIYRFSHRPPLRKLRLPGILARSGLLNRVRLSPEGATLPEMQHLTRFLLRQGLRLFTLSYHSPSLLPGCTPYVRHRDDLAAFLARLHNYLAFFSQQLGGRFTTPLEVRQLARPSHG